MLWIRSLYNVPKDLCRCHTKRMIDRPGHANPSFGMTLALQYRMCEEYSVQFYSRCHTKRSVTKTKIFRGHSKNNEANVLHNGQKIIYLWYISTSFFLIRATIAQITWVSHHSRINSLHAIFLSCLIILGITLRYVLPWPGSYEMLNMIT